ncbi:TIGR02594 family protein [Sphingomonas yantingensis]|uniref:Uncharacterized protein (TIGR02594 family) n=1 Tax=Sphingomonas yantingensis TaxID=1241761 RepID=A0A7W9AMH0_9SPHN|nr:TIGR02594 family protein [Sphingomonas yantingensis]MBB5696996.1 uncharacterized protein (TIGR02594 family) [Sphingomonas yantingensis]
MTTEPAWLTAARAKLGTREAPGVANNPTILGWAKRLGVKVLGIAYNADSVPWCGLFVAWCLSDAGFDLAADGLHRMRVAVRASAWATWGSNLARDRLAPGAILVFERPGGGHVGFYVGEDTAAYHVLGGNQGDSVTVTRIAKARLVASRWPKGVPVIGAPVRLATSGKPLSSTEA